jgi:ComF family protein
VQYDRVHELLRGLLDLFLPPVCLACDKLIASGDAARLVCRRCRTLLRPPPPPLCERCGAPRLRTGRPDREHCGECERWPTSIAHARSAFLLHAPADRIVHQLKYRGWQGLAPIMAAAMARVLLPDAMRWYDVVQPVPTTRSRMRERGYNQAGLIAASYAQNAKKQCVDWLERSPASSSQTTLQPAKRAANVAGAFRVSAAGWNSISGARILVIDDVLTTGATVAECAETLAAAGAASVCVLTYARALDTNRLLGY